MIYEPVWPGTVTRGSVDPHPEKRGRGKKGKGNKMGDGPKNLTAATI